MTPPERAPEDSRVRVAVERDDGSTDTYLVRREPVERCEFCGHLASCCPTPAGDTHHHMVPDHGASECPRDI